MRQEGLTKTWEKPIETGEVPVEATCAQKKSTVGLLVTPITNLKAALL